MATITKRALAEAAKGGTPRVLWDNGHGSVAGLGVRVGRSGASWIVQGRIGTGRAARAVKITLGSVGLLSLGQARERAAAILREARDGRDPRVTREQAQARTVAAVVARWIAQEQAQRRRGHEVARLMERTAVPAWGRRDVATIARADVAALLDGFAIGRPVYANRLRAHLHRFFAWAAARGLVPGNPVEHVERPTRERPRERVLSLTELRAVWKAGNSIVRLLILTGCRRSEIGGLRWDEVFLEGPAPRIELPPERTKGGRAHVVPLSEPAVEILAQQPRVLGRGAVFAAVTGSSGFAGWSVLKASLDRRVGPLPGGAWRLHDLRRSVATQLAEHVGTPPHVVEAILGHALGGVAAVYNRSRHEAAKREALDAWARLLLQK